MSNESSPPKGDVAETHEETKPVEAPAAKVAIPPPPPEESAGGDDRVGASPEVPMAAVSDPGIDVVVEEVVAPPPPPPLTTSNLPPRAWPPEVVADIMTRKVITLREAERVGDLEAQMERFRFRHLPVVDEHRRLVGLITRVDFLHAALGIGPDGKPIEKLGEDTRAAEIMNRNVVTAQIDTPVLTTAQVMIREKLGCVPVLLPDQTLVGIVTLTDLARLAVFLMEKR
jgi:CBS domain-containing protein